MHAVHRFLVLNVICEFLFFKATAIASMIQPRITQQEVCPYFWNHLEHDLQVLCRAIGRSPDEAYLLLHYLCHQLTRDSKGMQYSKF